MKVLLSDIPMPVDLELGAQAPLSVPLFRGLPELLTHASVHMYVCALVHQKSYWLHLAMCQALY